MNGIFLNITEGSHINVSTFKPLEKIEVLPIEFFNKLIEYRTACEVQRSEAQAQPADGTTATAAPHSTFTYKDWYAWNFGRHAEIAKTVEIKLRECFPAEDSDAGRILDLWLDMPGAKEGSYAEMHFHKLDKDFKKIEKAIGATDRLANSITVMDQFKNMT